MICPLVILAAGQSSRLGQPKQLVSFRGKTLLHRAVDTALSVSVAGWQTPLAVVLGAQAEACWSEIETLTIDRLTNDDWAGGMASSVHRAVEWAVDQAADALILLLCDQPFVTPDLLVSLIETHRLTGSSIVASVYDNGTVGVPVLFAKNRFSDLLALHGDRGAQVLLRQYPELVVTIPFPEGKFDLDTPEDLARLASLE
ncbi:MAG: nucleotidyltransferase family protein [Cytophagaceae bacterium]|nr:nucleotidyltransferase family protein [Cytophagaceae bacterium]